MTKVLIIRLSSIGDIVLTTPVIRNLKEQKSDVEIHYLVKNKYKSLLVANPYIDKLWTVDSDVNQVLPSLIAEKYNHIIDLHHNLRSLKIKKKLRVSASIVNKLNIKKWIWVNMGVNLMPDRHIVDRYMDCLDIFHIKNDLKGLDYHIPNSDKVDIVKSLKINPHTYISWAIGATYSGKRLSVERTIAVLKDLPQPIVLMGGEVDKQDAEKIIAAVGDNVVNAVGKFNINQSASIIQQSTMVVCPDTGLMHIASAMTKNIVSIWGCTTPGLGMSPYMAGEHSIIVEPEGLTKRPCSKLGNRCKYKGGCINRITSTKLIDTVNRVFELSSLN